MSSDDRPLLLGLDAATPPASVALIAGRTVVASCSGPFGRGTDAWIIAAVDEVLAAAGRRLAEVDAFAATAGPGTFTGIRVGLATALGLGRGAHRPAAGIGTLEAMVVAARTVLGAAVPVIAVVDARREQLYAGLASPGAGTLAWGPELVAAERVRDLAAATPEARLVGTAGGLLTDLAVLLPGDDLPPVAVGAALAAGARLAGGGLDALPPPRPHYLRPADAVPGQSPLRRRRRL